MLMFSTDFHCISVGTLIQALGLLTDNAVIAIEMLVGKQEESWDRSAHHAYAYHSEMPGRLAASGVVNSCLNTNSTACSWNSVVYSRCGNRSSSRFQTSNRRLKASICASLAQSCKGGY